MSNISMKINTVLRTFPERSALLYISVLLFVSTLGIYTSSRIGIAVISTAMLLYFILFEKIDLKLNTVDIFFILYLITVTIGFGHNISLDSFLRFVSIPVSYLLARFFKDKSFRHNDMLIFALIITILSSFSSMDRYFDSYRWTSTLWKSPILFGTYFLYAILMIILANKDKYCVHLFFLIFIFGLVTRVALLSYCFLLVFFYSGKYLSYKAPKIVDIYKVLISILFVTCVILYVFYLISYKEGTGISASLNIKSLDQLSPPYLNSYNSLWFRFKGFAGMLSIYGFLCYLCTILTKQTKNKKFWILILIGFLIGSLHFNLKKSNFKIEKHSKHKTYSMNLNKRDVLAKYTWEKIISNPLGIGIGQGKHFYKDNKNTSSAGASHNFLLTIILEQGWVAGIAYLALILVMCIYGNYLQTMAILFGHIFMCFQPGTLFGPSMPPFFFLFLYFILFKNHNMHLWKRPPRKQVIDH